jgi:hypothetical protein
LFLNGRKIPDRYTLIDLGFLIPQLVEQLPKKSIDIAFYK